MKKVLVFATALLAFYTSNAQDEATVSVTVTVENVLNDEGTVLISLHSSETFMKGQGIMDKAEKAKKGALTVTFDDVASGTYAIMAMHDTNDNKRMDFEANGMPKESYGMSGNDMAMGPPSFDMAQFEVADENVTLSIRF
ncbi:MAG: DUF2141 domain-containing protein [Bacteroidota bacterium]